MLSVPSMLQPEPLSLWQATAGLHLCRRHPNTQRQVWLSFCGVSGWVWGLILNEISPLLLSCWDFFFALGRGISFFGVIQHSPADGCSTASINFRVLAENEYRSFYSTILDSKLLLLLLFKKYICQPGNQDLQLYYSLYIHCTFHFISRGILEIK